MQARKSKLEKDRAKIARYRALTKKVLESKNQKLYTTEALEDTATILNVNPEFNAVWNYRRNILAHLFSTGSISKPEALGGDLHMSMEMMKRYPKCYWIWNHRRWCLEKSDEFGIADWGRELAIASKVLSMDSRNFHGWQYRRYVVSNMERHAAAKTGPEGYKEQLDINLREFQYTTAVINKSTSNFSAWHNRTTLITKILVLLRKCEEIKDPLELSTDAVHTEKTVQIFQSPLDLLSHELDLVKTGMFMDADDTSVWLYMQWLLTDDIFVRGLSPEKYTAVIHQQLSDVNELNQLEKEDSLAGSENVWCLKTIIFLRALLSSNNGLDQDVKDDSEIQRALGLLVDLDPLRKGHYLDQLSGKAAIC
ncbi:hypothetical protein JCM33374_g3100 [Metschnikowia sp. JCM 33374]|nr:hypothetical protein JCM33374_g3100 [Metschnikowia sp. JCM 33374]